MRYVKVRNQQELDAALKQKDVIPECIGDGYFEVDEDGSKVVTA